MEDKSAQKVKIQLGIWLPEVSPVVLLSIEKLVLFKKFFYSEVQN